MLKRRDKKAKQALIEYLQRDTDERFWQAISNFSAQHGLSCHYILTSDSPDASTGVRDLFNQESDEYFVD